MKKINVRYINSIILLIFVAAQVFADNNYRVVSGADLNIRKEASVTSKILGTFQNGEEIEVQSITNGWAKVKYNNKTGYVLAQYLQELENNNSVNLVEDNQPEPMSGKVIAPLLGGVKETSEISDDDRRKSFFEIFYAASSFDDVKASGCYGISWTFLPWELSSQTSWGFHASPAAMNFGLVDSEAAGCAFRLGPALGCNFSDNLLLSVPLDVVCFYVKKTYWGLSLAPSLYIGKNAGIFIGPQFNVSFQEGSKVNCGFQVGLFL